MGDLVNLRQARKRKARAADEVLASESRLLHGRTKAEKVAEASRRETLRRHVDGHFVEAAPEADAGPENSPPLPGQPSEKEPR